MKLHEALRIKLATIDDALLDVIRTDPDLPPGSIVREVVARLIHSGGKRIRPMMTIVGGRFGREDGMPRVLRVAAAMEYVHMASLIHDDIIDNSDLRRGEPAVHKRIGIQDAILVADYMTARAVEWAAEPIGDTDGGSSEDDEHEAALCGRMAFIVTGLCRGEYRQLDNRFRFDATLDEYLAKTYDKTASLIAGCIRAGADAAGADPETAELLQSFGEALGMVFQIRDDIQDFTKDAAELGKPAGADLRGGVITLPVLLAMDASPIAAAAIRTLDADASEPHFQAAVECVITSGAIDRSYALIDEYTAAMERIIAQLQSHPAHADLRALASYFSR